MTRIPGLPALAMVVGVGACGPSERTIDGQYSAKDVHGIHRLSLAADGSYRQEFYLSDGSQPFATHESQWTYQRVPGVVVLATPMQVSDYAPAKSVRTDDVRYWVRSCGDAVCLDQHAPWSGKTSVWPYERQPD